MKVLERPIGSRDFVAGQTRTIELPRNYAYRKLYLKLKADIVHDDSATGAATILDSAPAQLINSISIRANGRDVIKNLDFEALHRLTQQRYGCRPYIDRPDGVFGTSAFDDSLVVCAVIDFEMWRAIRPADTFFPSGKLSTLELIINWGNVADMYHTWTGGSLTSCDATLYVDSLEAIGMPSDAELMINKENRFTQQISTSGDHQISLPVGNVYRQIAIRTKDSNNENVNDMLSSIKLQSGTEVYKLWDAARLQFANRLEMATESPISQDTQDRFWHEDVIPGYYLLDFVKDGRLTESLDTSKMSELQLVLNVSSSGTTSGQIDIYPTELLMPSGG
jgi:hypothetical protein